jgi:hypothetical protein
MMDLTILQQGRFTSSGSVQTLQIRSDVDWIRVYNETALIQAAADLGYEFYWQRGMTNGRGVLWTKLGTVANDPVTVGQIAANAGFFLIDSSVQNPGAAVAETAITNAVQPVVTTANTGSLATGSIVRLNSDTNLPNIMGFDYEVDTVVANTSFRMRWALANAPGAAGAGDGFYRQIPFDPIYYPRRRFIVNITQAASAVIRLSVAHGYTVGQEIRFVVPAEFGMIEMNGLSGTITAISTALNTITVDIDSTAFTAFVFPAVADVPFTWAQAVPLGEDTAQALTSAVDILGDATLNTAFLGMNLAAGTLSPAGQTNDVIYWVAGKSFSVTNL